MVTFNLNQHTIMYPDTAKKHLANGYKVKQTHAGQLHRYGDSFYEYEVESDKPEEEVKQYCAEHVRQCKLTEAEYLADERAGVKDFGDHFRDHYSFRKTGEGKYFYRVTSPSTH